MQLSVLRFLKWVKVACGWRYRCRRSNAALANYVNHRREKWRRMLAELIVLSAQ